MGMVGNPLWAQAALRLPYPLGPLPRTLGAEHPTWRISEEKVLITPNSGPQFGWRSDARPQLAQLGPIAGITLPSPALPRAALPRTALSRPASPRSAAPSRRRKAQGYASPLRWE